MTPRNSLGGTLTSTITRPHRGQGATLLVWPARSSAGPTEEGRGPLDASAVHAVQAERVNHPGNGGSETGANPPHRGGVVAWMPGRAKVCSDSPFPTLINKSREVGGSNLSVPREAYD